MRYSHLLEIAAQAGEKITQFTAKLLGLIAPEGNT